jgi:hypothetical protein
MLVQDCATGIIAAVLLLGPAGAGAFAAGQRASMPVPSQHPAPSLRQTITNAVAEVRREVPHLAEPSLRAIIARMSVGVRRSRDSLRRLHELGPAERQAWMGEQVSWKVKDWLRYYQLGPRRGGSSCTGNCLLWPIITALHRG